jgi:hypothetical protein
LAESDELKEAQKLVACAGNLLANCVILFVQILTKFVKCTTKTSLVFNDFCGKLSNKERAETAAKRRQAVKFLSNPRYRYCENNTGQKNAGYRSMKFNNFSFIV